VYCYAVQSGFACDLELEAADGARMRAHRVVVAAASKELRMIIEREDERIASGAGSSSSSSSAGGTAAGVVLKIKECEDAVRAASTPRRPTRTTHCAYVCRNRGTCAMTNEKEILNSFLSCAWQAALTEFMEIIYSRSKADPFACFKALHAINMWLPAALPLVENRLLELCPPDAESAVNLYEAARACTLRALEAHAIQHIKTSISKHGVSDAARDSMVRHPELVQFLLEEACGPKKRRCV